jgi:hypothetical protein
MHYDCLCGLHMNAPLMISQTLAYKHQESPSANLEIVIPFTSIVLTLKHFSG